MKKGPWLIIALFLLALAIAVLAAAKAGGATVYQTFQSGPISIELPPLAPENSFQPDSNIVFSKFFRDDDLAYWGYLQLWKINDLEDFLAKSKESSMYCFLNYTTKEVKVATLKGLEIDWVAQTQSDETITAREYFLKKDSGNEVLRISFFTNKKALPAKVDEILKTLKWQ